MGNRTKGPPLSETFVGLLTREEVECESRAGESGENSSPSFSQEPGI